MYYFKPRSFVLHLRNAVIDKYSVEKISSKPLKYKIASSEESFAFLYFETVNGEVEVALEFSEDAEDDFTTDLSKHIEATIESPISEQVES